MDTFCELLRTLILRLKKILIKNHAKIHFHQLSFYKNFFHNTNAYKLIQKHGKTGIFLLIITYTCCL